MLVLLTNTLLGLAHSLSYNAQRFSWARLTFFIYHVEKMIFTKFSPQLLNRSSKRFILNLFKTNYELAQLYVDFSHVLSQVAFSKIWNGWNRRTNGDLST
ncbi:hypothetical protein HanHA89_Chr13g0500831 [Helianthus annuus]|nr:hypothetical protein HanHA89_Chr13g0500831 [Helianthus annuus]